MSFSNARVRPFRTALLAASLVLAATAGSSPPPLLAGGEPSDAASVSREARDESRAAVDTPSIDLHSCELSGTERGARCGTLTVPEDRSEPDGREIGLRVVIVPARETPSEPDPVFFLAGGPGQAATALAARRAGGPIGANRDLVFVDQRGTGGSNPLRCDHGGVAGAARAYLGGRVPPGFLSECLDSLDADPRRYTTGPAVEDLEDVREALGYERINLAGASYGTRVALVYARRHEKHLRSMILRGVAPLSYRFPLPFARGSQHALDALATACRSDRACRERFGDPRRLLARGTDSLSEEPGSVAVSGPRLPDSARITLDGRTVRGTVLLSLYSVRGASRLLPLVGAAAAGEYRPLAAWGASLATRFAEQIHLGMFLSVICSEDAPRIGDGEISATARGTYLGGSWIRSILAGCAVWPEADVDEGFFDPVRADVPALLISGAADPVTRPRWAERLAERLPRARHVVVPAAGHLPTFPGCTGELAREFLEAGSARGLDVGCVRSREWPSFGAMIGGRAREPRRSTASPAGRIQSRPYFFIFRHRVVRLIPSSSAASARTPSASLSAARIASRSFSSSSGARYRPRSGEPASASPPPSAAATRSFGSSPCRRISSGRW